MNGRRAGEEVAKAIETERFKYEMERRTKSSTPEVSKPEDEGPDERVTRIRHEENVRVVNVFAKVIEALDTLESLDEKRRVVKALMVLYDYTG